MIDWDTCDSLSPMKLKFSLLPRLLFSYFSSDRLGLTLSSTLVVCIFWWLFSFACTSIEVYAFAWQALHGWFLLLLLQDASGQKMINEYVKECTIGHGSYGKVVRTSISCQKIIVSQVIFKMFFFSKTEMVFSFLIMR